MVPQRPAPRSGNATTRCAISGWFCDLLPALEIRKEHMREQALDEAAIAYHDATVGLDQRTIADALDPGRFIAERNLEAAIDAVVARDG